MYIYNICTYVYICISRDQEYLSLARLQSGKTDTSNEYIKKYIYECIYMYIYIYICMYSYTCIYVYTHTHTCVYIHICVYTYICIYMYIHI